MLCIPSNRATYPQEYNGNKSSTELYIGCNSYSKAIPRYFVACLTRGLPRQHQPLTKNREPETCSLKFQTSAVFHNFLVGTALYVSSVSPMPYYMRILSDPKARRRDLVGISRGPLYAPRGV
jgi:hypothetical protein